MLPRMASIASTLNAPQSLQIDAECGGFSSRLPLNSVQDRLCLPQELLVLVRSSLLQILLEDELPAVRGRLLLHQINICATVSAKDDLLQAGVSILDGDTSSILEGGRSAGHDRADND